MVKTLKRPKTPVKDFELALTKANLTQEDIELIDYIRYTSVFTQPSIVKDLRRTSKPPILSILCSICREIGKYMPDHFCKIREWSSLVNKDGVRWDGHLICAEAFNIDGESLCPEERTTLFEVLAVHKELFTGFD